MILPSESGKATAIAILNLYKLWNVNWIHSDNGPNFTSRQVEGICEYLNIKHTYGIPWNPQSQAIVENKHKELKRLTNQFREQTETLQAALDLALIVLNKKQRGGIGDITPWELMIYQMNTDNQEQINIYKTQNNKKFCYYRLQQGKQKEN